MVTTELHMFPFLVQVLLVHKTEIIHSPNSHRKTMNVSQRKETDKNDIKKKSHNYHFSGNLQAAAKRLL